jgi:hypothetical protein
MTGRGHQNDEDSFNGGIPYSNTFSDKVEGHLNYAVADIGYDFIRESSHKVGAFVGLFIPRPGSQSLQLPSDR